MLSILWFTLLIARQFYTVFCTFFSRNRLLLLLHSKCVYFLCVWWIFTYVYMCSICRRVCLCDLIGESQLLHVFRWRCVCVVLMYNEVCSVVISTGRQADGEHYCVSFIYIQFTQYFTALTLYNYYKMVYLLNIIHKFNLNTRWIRFGFYALTLRKYYPGRRIIIAFFSYIFGFLFQVFIFVV